jgi:hypothetical protein
LSKNKRINIILISVLGIIVITSIVFILRKSNNHPKQFSSKFGSGEKIQFTEYRDGKKVFAISIDNFSIERAKIGPFAIGPLIQANFNKVQVDLYLDDDQDKRGSKTPAGKLHSSLEKVSDHQKNPPNMENSAKKMPGQDNPDVLKNLGESIEKIKKNLPTTAKRIKSMKLHDIAINLWKDESRIFKLEADSAFPDSQSGDLLFVGHASLDGGAKGKLIAYRIVWNNKSRLFYVPEAYVFIKGQEKKEGTGFETDYQFKHVNHKLSR